MDYKKLIRKIRQAREVVHELVLLALEIGTLVAVIKMVIESLT